MYGLTKKEKLEFILKKVGEFELTSYDIGKKTNLSMSGIEKILNGTSKNPHEKTLDIILEMLEKKNIGSNTRNTDNTIVNEMPAEDYNKKGSDLIKYAECLEKENKLIKEIVKLQNLLRDNNVDFENFFDNERK